MSWRILITAQAMVLSGQAGLSRLKEAGHQIVMPPAPRKPIGPEVVEWLEGVDAVIAGVERYDRSVLNHPSLRPLKIISRWGVGYDSVDIAAATEAGVVVAYTPGLLNEAVADYAFSLLCAVARRVHTGHQDLTQGSWAPTWGHNIHGKTLALLGCGRIGQALARRAAGFGMRVIAHDPRPTDEARRLGVEFVSLDALLRDADFLSLHAALTAETRGMIGEAQLRQMKPSAYLINTARGGLIDEAALTTVLRERVIAGAALDTFQVEPLAPDHPFLKTPGLLLTPHQASYTHETGALVSAAAANAILEAAAGRRPRWVVNESVLQSSAMRASLSRA
ncbi:MAG: phosphoglycerate dehydrogenase [Verrucomicrobia bacterium]|nr:phosphoglycerate dehydrogenase [Verrucomicrobiota bacterium]MBI3868170.1 phosphoglycerate dehydrogenase [Verrucomicrobiota bacterium]